jgi:uncharacterized protein YjbI with pentapeptide repeats
MSPASYNDELRMNKLRNLTYQESCRELQKAGWLAPGIVPSLPLKRPNYDDDGGVRLFRTLTKDKILENLTLPRTFLGRSEIRNVSFAGSDLSESTLCWNDFVWVDFTNCDLSKCDMRAAVFDSVKFRGANLNQSDLRIAHFKDCDFSNASLQNAKLTKSQGLRLNLSPQQRLEIDWQELDGDEPAGG